MEDKDSFTLSWCVKHKNWWVTNCPDCMVDSNEESIRNDEREAIADHFEKIELPENEDVNNFLEMKVGYNQGCKDTRQFFINELRRKK